MGVTRAAQVRHGAKEEGGRPHGENMAGREGCTGWAAARCAAASSSGVGGCNCEGGGCQ